MNLEIVSCTGKCRACMEEGGKMIHMYDENVISQINLPHKLAELTSIQIDKFDGLPNMLCSKCAYRTNTLYNFRQKVQESDKKYRKLLNNKMDIVKKELMTIKKSEDSTVQANESSELNISTNIKCIDNIDTSENLEVETLDEAIKSEQQYVLDVSQLIENNGKENLQLNNLFYNLVQENSEDQMNIHFVKTEIPEEISKMLASQDVTIMYISKSGVESTEEALIPEQEGIANCNEIFIPAVKILKEEENGEISNNIYISNLEESNVTKKNKCTYWEHEDDNTTENKNKRKKSNGSNSETEQLPKVRDSNGSDSDYFIDTKDNILGSVNDAIIRIKEVQQENGIEYQCTLCLQNYEELPSVLLHTVDNHVPSSGPFFCMLCEKDCESHRELRAHVKTHTGQFPYSCFICKKAYTRKRYLKRHMVCHPDFPRHRCPKCGCRFKTKSELDSHTIKTHTDKVPYSCNQCPRVFNHKGNFKRHLISHLDPQGVRLPKYPCKFCSKRFPNNRTLETHTRVHTGERPFKCEYCNKSFSQRGNLLNHTRIHLNPRSYTCEVCGKRFNQRATLRDHGLLHTGEKPHVCTICGKAFTVTAALRRHMFNHSDYKPFKCDTCGMGFVGKYDLRRHMRVHEDRPREKRRRNTALKLEECLSIVEEPDTETVLVEEVLLSQDYAQDEIKSEKEDEDALFIL